MKFDIKGPYSIGRHWLTYLEYGDISGLTEEEEKQADTWLSQFPGASFTYGENWYFATDDISGLKAECVDVNVYIPIKEMKKTSIQ